VFSISEKGQGHQSVLAWSLPPRVIAMKHGPIRFNFTEIHRRTGLSISHISRIFRGERKPSVDALVVIAKAVNLPVESLLRILKIKS
jgi:transcriptional regulator with XRE-family HTH domain